MMRMYETFHHGTMRLRKELRISLDSVSEAGARAKEILQFKDQLDEAIASSSDAYEFSRIPLVERNILRLGLYELLYDPAIPPKVALAESIRLTRKFSTPEAARFVNAILDHLYRKDLGEQGDDVEITTSLEEMARTGERAHEVVKQAEELGEESSEES